MTLPRLNAVTPERVALHPSLHRSQTTAVVWSIATSRMHPRWVAAEATQEERVGEQVDREDLVDENARLEVGEAATEAASGRCCRRATVRRTAVAEQVMPPKAQQALWRRRPAGNRRPVDQELGREP